MKAGILFTGNGPILIITTYSSLEEPNLIDKLNARGISKFIGYEVPEEEVRRRYGRHYEVVLGDLKQSDDLRVLDFDGNRVFNNFSLEGRGEPVCNRC